MKKRFLFSFFVVLRVSLGVSQTTSPAPLKTVDVRTDSLLIGTWIFVADKSSGSGHTFVDYVQKTKWIFRTDGSYEKGAQLIRSAGQTAPSWTEPTEKGTWRSKENKVYVYMINGQVIPVEKRLQGTYYIEGPTMIFTDAAGKKQIWRKETPP